MDRIARRPVTCYTDYSDLLIIYVIGGVGGRKETYLGRGAEEGGWWLGWEWSKKGCREMNKFKVIWLASQIRLWIDAVMCSDKTECCFLSTKGQKAEPFIKFFLK